MTIFAYLRVSTDKGQTTDNQRKTIFDKSITDAGFAVDEWYSEDGVSGKINALDRPVFKALMDKATAGDTVIVVALDRLGRNTIDILNTVERFKEKKIRLRCMALDAIDLTSTGGKILVHMLALIAEIERDAVITRTAAGIARAKDEGKVFGRYLTISPQALNLMRNERLAGKTYREIADTFNVNKDTICQTLKTWGEMLEHYEETWNKQQQQKLTKTMKGNKNG